MRTIGLHSCIIALAAVALLTSCDPVSSVEYTIRNLTDDTVTVDMYREILTSSYQGFDVVLNDSVAIHYGLQDSIRVATLAPNQLMRAQYVWDGIYREERVVPMWKYIKSIAVGDNELSPEAWNNEQAWHLKKTGGGMGEGETRNYDLNLRGK